MNAMKPYQQHLSPRLPSSQRLIYKSKIAVEAAGINDSSQSNSTDGVLRSRMFKLQRVIPNHKPRNRTHNQLNKEINSTLLSSRSSEENTFADEQYGSVAMKEKHDYSDNSRAKLPPNRANHYAGDEGAAKENYDDSTESQSILLCSEKQDYFENRDSVHKTFYGRMNQALHEGLAISAKQHAALRKDS